MTERYLLDQPVSVINRESFISVFFNCFRSYKKESILFSPDASGRAENQVGVGMGDPAIDFVKDIGSVSIHMIEIEIPFEEVFDHWPHYPVQREE